MPTWREYRIIDPLPGGGVLWDSSREELFRGIEDVRSQLDYWRDALKRETDSGQPYVAVREVTATPWQRIDVDRKRRAR